MKGKTADCHMLLRMIGEIKVSRDRFKYAFVVFVLRLHHEGSSRNRSPSRLPVSLMYNFLQRVQVMPSRWHWLRYRFYTISDLDGSLGSRYFINVSNERTCFTSCASAFKTDHFCLECTSDWKVTYVFVAFEYKHDEICNAMLYNTFSLNDLLR